MRLALAVSVALLAAGAAQAAPTKVTIRAQALDAKFIGTSMGGVRVVLRDAKSGKVLAQGITAGGTGDTKRLVTEPRTRGQALVVGEAAAFTATLNIERPTLVRAEASGPLSPVGAAVSVTSSLWVLPGRDVAGDGWVLNFPGLTIDPTVTPAGGGLDVKAKVNLMCGCPIERGGVWDAANYQVSAYLLDGLRQVSRIELPFSGETSVFAGRFGDVAPGRYRLQITAADRSTINAGVAEAPVSVPAPRSSMGRGQGRSAR